MNRVLRSTMIKQYLKNVLKELQTKKETLDSRFAFGEIDNELYNRFIGAVDI